MIKDKFDILIIGGGPAGYVAAIKAAQMGFKVACIEQNSTLGGTCLNIGCIPSKALLHTTYLYHQAKLDFNRFGITCSDISFNLATMLDYKNQVVHELTQGISFLFLKYKVTLIKGFAQFINHTSVNVAGNMYQADHIIIATGSKAIPLKGLEIDEKQIVSSTGALNLQSVPKHLIIIGGGYIGLELGSVWRRLGAEVTIVEYNNFIIPILDHEIRQHLFNNLQQQGIKFKLSQKFIKAEKYTDKLSVTLEGKMDQQLSYLEGDVILSCIGRQPNTSGLNLEKVGIILDAHGYIAVQKNYATTISNIYAIGDIIKGPMLAHKAQEEAIACIEGIAGQKPEVNYATIPSVIYTSPEVSFIGQTEEQLQQAVVNYKVGKFPFQANGRAKAMHQTNGFIKILTDVRTDEILGVHIIHHEAGTLIAEAVLAMEYRASAEDIARTCHAHPTLNEVYKEASLAAFSKPIHI